MILIEQTSTEHFFVCVQTFPKWTIPAKVLVACVHFVCLFVCLFVPQFTQEMESTPFYSSWRHAVLMSKSETCLKAFVNSLQFTHSGTSSSSVIYPSFY